MENIRAKEIKGEIIKVKNKLNSLVAERNQLIRERYKDLYNINNYNKVKVGYVYIVLSKEFELSEATIKTIISTKDDRVL